jgi:hypothetical protein
MSRWRDILIHALGGVDHTPRGSFVVGAEFERAEEMRPDRLGPTEDLIRDEDPTWQPPPDQGRPSTTLGPMG